MKAISEHTASARRAMISTALILASVLLPASGAAQTVPSPSASTEKDDTVMLSPFQVVTEKDVGYTAASALSGGRVNTALKDTPAAMTVITRQFLDDILATDPSQVVEWAVNMAPNYELNKSSFSTYTYNPRNLGSAGGTYATRNYFLWYGLSDDYNIERYEFARGPNGTIYGDTNLGGIPTTWSKRAKFGSTRTVAQLRADTYGGWRSSLDVNLPLSSKLAMRVNLLHDARQDWYDVSHNETNAVSFAGTYRFTKRDEFRIDAETGQYFHQYYTHNNSDQASFWDRISVYDGVTAPAKNTTTGLGAPGAGLVYIPGVGAGNSGLNDMTPFFATTGTGIAIRPTARTDIPNFPVLPSRSFSLNPRDHVSGAHYFTYAGAWDHTFSENLNTEVGFARSAIHRHNGKAGSGNIFNNYRIDVNKVLPGATPGTFVPNPNFGKAYDDQAIAEQENENNVTQVNVLANWRFATSWLKQTFGGMIGTRLDRFSVHQDRLVRTDNPTLTNGVVTNLGLGNSANFVLVRRYWDQAGLPLGDNPVPTDIPGRKLGWVPQSGQYQRKAIDFLQLASTSQFFKDRLTVQLGLRSDHILDSQTINIASDPFTGLPVLGAVIPDPANPFKTIQAIGARTHTDTKTHSSNAGFVYYFIPSLGLWANYAQSIKASTAGSAELDGTVPPPPHNSGKDIGLKLNLFGGKVSGSINFYTNRQKGNIAFSNTTQNVIEINRIWTNIGQSTKANLSVYTDTQDFTGQGWEFDVTANPSRQLRLTWNLALPRTSSQSLRPSLTSYVAANLKTWQDGAAANPGSAAQINQDITTIQTFLNAQTPGTPLNDTYKYTSNLYGTYTFSSGRAKGFSLGGGVNLRGKNKISTVTGQPYQFLYADSYYLLRVDLSYRYKISDKLAVRFQLGITNLLDNDSYVNSSQDGGAYNTYRLNNISTNPLIQVPDKFRQQDPRKATFSTTFEF